MRIVTWNHCGGRNKARLALERLRPDVLVLQETRRDEHEGLPGRFWSGADPQRGVAIVVADGWQLELAELPCDAQAFLPVAVQPPSGDPFAVLGCWVQRVAPGGNPVVAGRYWDVLLRGLEAHAELLETGCCVVVGDLNVFLDEEVAEILRAELGLVSAYHVATTESYLGESRMTHRHSHGRATHIDYCLVPEWWSVDHVELGDWNEWGKPVPADHVPLIVEVTVPT